MRFSIVIPVYNVEKYIRRCLDSVMNQTFQDFELIIVNDETPDNSMAIVEEFQKVYPEKIRVFHQKNTRQGGARNNGARQARGEYLLFVDSDDYVRQDMLSFVDQKLQEEPCDILVFQYLVVSETGKPLGKGSFFDVKPGSYDPMVQKEILGLPSGPTNKAYKRQFYLDSGMLFPEKLLYEDGMIRLAYAKASRIVVCDECLYYYVQSTQSTMRRRVSEKMLDILTMTDLIIAAFEQHGLYETYRDILEYSFVGSLLSVFSIVNQEDPKSPIQDKFADYILRVFPGFRDNPYLHPGVKDMLQCICSRDFRRYHYRYVVLAQWKSRLIQNPVLAKLNQLRKR